MELTLEPEQEEILTALVEASRGRPRDERTFNLWSLDQGDFIAGVGAEGHLPALPDDVETFEQLGFVKITNRGKRGSLTFYVTTAALEHDESLKRRPVDSIDQVEHEMRSLLDSKRFRSIYSTALDRWAEAVDLLWSANAPRELTTIGHKAREAMMAFATALVERHKPPEYAREASKTVDRVRAVLQMYRSSMSYKHVALLDALLPYWGTSVDLVQRQEHGAEREGEELTWEDGRRVVLQTAVVMLEVHRAVEPFYKPQGGE
ncbi:MAG TPA: hypothetical protein VGV57_06000 [Thermoleophilaceae bacterium]|nr:hypothetical protein [Thermoleophilaceae bacterium]